jgi:hypothetical protein
VATLGVLAWRLVNFWLPIPAGAAAYVSLKVPRGAGLPAMRAAVASLLSRPGSVDGLARDAGTPEGDPDGPAPGAVAPQGDRDRPARDAGAVPRDGETTDRSAQ